MKRSRANFWLFLSPALLSFVVVVFIPMLMGFGYAFTNWSGVGGKLKFIGFENFIKMFIGEPYFVRALVFTFGITFFTVILVNLVGMSLAFLVTQKFKIANFLRSVFFMPNLIGGLLLGFTWKFVFIDIFSAFGKLFGWNFLQGWLSNMHTGFLGILIVNVWQMSGYLMILYIAQLQTFTKITFPLLMPAFTVGMFLSIANSFKMFDQNLALTNGAPYRSTEMLALNIYNTAFASNANGYAQAKAIVLLIIVATIGLTSLIITKKKEVEM